MTGINPWWTYSEESVPGVGRSEVNVGNGNFLLQADDVDIHERGIDLAFRRTYNSMSGHDVYNTDGSTPSVYGNKWTNTFDSHLTYNPAIQVMSVYDIDGARYDYTASNGSWIPPVGQYAQLTSDGGCGYYWTKKSGTVYHYYSPVATSCGFPAGVYGRLGQILARNQNSYISFSYSWSGTGSNPEQLTQIVASHSDGQSLTLNFASFGSYTELSSIVRPDGAQIVYSYDTNGNLLEVDRAGNNAASVLPETYSYSSAGTSAQIVIYSPRATIASRAGSQDGSYYTVQLTANQTTGTSITGLLNPTPSDGTNTPIQGGPAWTTIDARTFSGYGSGVTAFVDSFGHATNYSVDSAARVYQTSEWTGSQWLITDNTWDAYNNLIAQVDARGNETDLAYNSAGDTIAVASPAIATSAGTFRPTKLFTYDAFYNVISYCDPVATHNLGLDWTSRPTQSQCPISTQAAQFTYIYPSYEPYGELSSSITPATAYAPNGYLTNYTYSPSQQGGSDYGLPTLLSGSAIAQVDGTTRQPQQSFSYDGFGNLICYSKGNGLWALGYDNLNRQVYVADPDDASVGPSRCGSSGQAGWNTQTQTQYFSDGSIQQTQTPAERAAGYASTFTYDADGDVISETKHYGCTTSACTPGVTTKWYDGADRLVEVAELAGVFQELTRYKYDLTTLGTVSLQNGPTFEAFGGLYATQVYDSLYTVATWYDATGSSFDALDRQTKKYAYPTSGSWQTATPVATTFSYDTDASHLDLLASQTDPLGIVTSMNYDADGQLVSQAFSDGTPGRVNSYDPDGRKTSVTSSAGTVSYQYDAAGRMAAETEQGTGQTLALTYGHYPDGSRSAMSTSGAYSAAGLLSYAYRADGKRSFERLQAGAAQQGFSWSYTPAGRETSFAYPNGQTTKAYDTAGRLATHAMASGTYTGFTYDGEGQVVGFNGVSATSNQLNPSNKVAQFSYNAKGQITSQILNYSIDYGGLVNATYYPQYGCPGDSYASCDIRTGAQYTTGFSAGLARTPGPANVGTTYTFDNAGRQVGQALAWNQTATCQIYRGGMIVETYQCDLSGSYNTARAFDAENHLIAESPHNVPSSEIQAGAIMYGCGLTSEPWIVSNGIISNPPEENGGPAQAPIAEYGYWPSGELQSDANLSDTIFWDGKSLLLDQAPSYTNIYLDDFAIYNATTSSLTVIDRDFAGMAVAQITSAGPSDWWPQGMYPVHGGGCPLTRARAWSYANGSSGADYVTPTYLFMPRPDGVADLYNIIQGARSYDSNVGQWTAPDAYAGDVHDPDTQRPYMWNNNNPFRYEDPSGFCTEGASGCLGGVDWNAVAAFANGLFAAMSLILPSGPEAGAASKAAQDAYFAHLTESDPVLHEALNGPGLAFAGNGTDAVLRDAPRLAATYGGSEGDWAKVTTTTVYDRDGTKIQIHYYQNNVTGERVEFKSSIKPPVKKK